LPTVSAYTETRVIAAPQTALFDLVADVERYPEFLPLWREARIVEREVSGYSTVQRIGLGPICERFQTHTHLHRPTLIEVTSADPKFTTFLIRWTFRARRAGACQVAVHLDWQVKSRFLQTAIDMVLADTARSMVDAFETRAHDLMTS
jgi:coenzyme Q-binding protein COQ10